MGGFGGSHRGQSGCLGCLTGTRSGWFGWGFHRGGVGDLGVSQGSGVGGLELSHSGGVGVLRVSHGSEVGVLGLFY